MSKFVQAAICMALLCMPAIAQFPEKLFVPVTFYDFHNNRSNPEFNQQHNGFLYTNMVQDTLDPEGKPILDSIIPNARNAYLKYWFRDWNSPTGGKNDMTMPKYKDSAKTFCELGWFPDCGLGMEKLCACSSIYMANISYLGPMQVSHDTAFKNIVINDTLQFLLLDSTNGIYQYFDTSFSRIKYKGFGAEYFFDLYGVPINDSNNTCFTMQINMDFQYRSGLSIIVESDDDMWLFINNSLAMDLGGFHTAISDTLAFDSISQKLSLNAGQACHASLFYTNRSSEAHLNIITNIFSPSTTKRCLPHISSKHAIQENRFNYYDLFGKKAIINKNRKYASGVYLAPTGNNELKKKLLLNY